MSRIEPEEVRALAALSRLELSDEEISKLAGELDHVLGYVEAIRGVDTDGVEPLTHAVPFDSPLREDRVEASFSIEDALDNAPRRQGRFFEVPRVVSKGGKK
jgi:aspartyl-tRNA(Asn)/glutamyl-tRNA(Gln) amidotransferase subunit C